MACFSHPCLSEAITHCKDHNQMTRHSLLQCSYSSLFLTCALHAALSMWEKPAVPLPLPQEVLYVDALSKHRTVQYPHCSW